MMQKALRVQTIVRPGGKIEINAPELIAGEAVEIIILVAEPIANQQSAVDILANAPGQRLFKSAEDVKQYLQEEREAWE
jgi:hypothetical protein